MTGLRQRLAPKSRGVRQGTTLSPPAVTADWSRDAKFTTLQGQYLAFIRAYTVIHRQAPAEADMERFFRVTPPSVHSMVLGLENRGLIERTPGMARSIRLLVPPAELPPLEEPPDNG